MTLSPAQVRLLTAIDDAAPTHARLPRRNGDTLNALLRRSLVSVWEPPGGKKKPRYVATRRGRAALARTQT